MPVAVAFAHGIDRPFHQEPDAGITWVYQALLVADGRPQTSWDHSGYVHFLLLGAWFKLLSLFGAVSAGGLAEVKAAAVPRAAFIELINAARVFAGIFVGLMAVMFYRGLRELARDRVVATAAAFVLVLTPGFVEQAIRIHTELFSVLFGYAALFLTIAAARRFGTTGLRLLALAALAAMLALLAKMQVLPLLLALPVFALLFGARPRPLLADPLMRLHDGTVFAVVAVGLALCVPAVAMTIAQTVALDEPPRIVAPEIFHAAIAGYLVLAMALFAHFHRPHWAPLALGLTAVAAGLAVGLYTLGINHDAKIFEVLVNYVDHMARYAADRGLQTAGAGAAAKGAGMVAALAGNLIDNVAATLARAFRLGTSGNLIAPLYWSLAAGVVLALILRQWRLAGQLALFLAVALGMEVFCKLRSFAPWYYVYVEPWIVVGNARLAAWLMRCPHAAAPALARLKRYGAIGVAAAAIATLVAILPDAFRERAYVLEPSDCGASYWRAPELPGLVCFK